MAAPVTISEKQYALSLIALCLGVFAHSYLLISVFPYSGYMAMALIEGVNQENAGSYAGLLASAFMFGRAITAVPFGKAADTYGRVVILQLSLVLSAIFSLLFGLAPTFGLALLFRFMLGLSNALLSTAKTVVSELANGNKELEERGMGLVMLMWGLGILVSPALSGFLSDPVKQYPFLFASSESNPVVNGLQSLLEKCPFLLPNLLGTIICTMSIISVNFLISETLPSEKLRHPKHMVGDVSSSIRGMYQKILSTVDEGEETGAGEDEMTRLKKKDDDLLAYNTTALVYMESGEYTGGAGAGAGAGGGGGGGGGGGNEFELPPELLNFVHVDVEDAIRRSILSSSHGEASMLSTKSSRSTMIRTIEKRTSTTSAQRRLSLATEDRDSMSSTATQEATVSSILADPNTRNHLIVFWIASFFTTAVDEGFPLYCMSLAYGLGLSEGSIGGVISASGLIYVVGQFFVYSAMLERFGLYGTIRIGSFFMGTVVLLIPFSRLLNQDSPRDKMSWETFAFLSAVLSIYRIMGIAFLSSIMVGCNRSVVASHRATMNGVQSLGGSIGKAIAPIFSGLLVSFSFSSGLFSPAFGPWFMWLVITSIGIVTTASTCLLLRDDDAAS